jgi:hypothetical protein
MAASLQGLKPTDLKVLLDHSIVEHAGCSNMTPDDITKHKAFLGFAPNAYGMLSQSALVGMGSHVQ